MEEWVKITLLLCMFGFLKELRPSEPFIYEYFIGPNWNLTEEQVLQDLYPIVVYSNLALLVVIFLITDLSRYKPLIVVSGLSGIIIWSTLLWAWTLLQLQIVEVAYGTFMATEVAYYTYIYAKVPKEHYSQVTAHTRAAILVGKCISSAASQFLMEFQVLDYRGLNYVTLSFTVAAALWALFLPSVPISIYFHRNLDEHGVMAKGKYQSAFILMKTHFLESFSNEYVLKWSLWWALSTAGCLQILTYSQPLWSEVYVGSSLHNGTVEALTTLVGCFAALSTNLIKVNWKQKRDLLLSVCSIISGALLLVSSRTEHLLVCYASYIAFIGLYHFTITITASEVAKCILEDSYGLVFGLNTFVALVVQTVATMFLVSGSIAWALNPRDQHVAYGVYYFIIALLFAIIGIVDWARTKNN